MENIATATKYDKLEAYLVDQSLAIDSVMISPAFSDYATDRSYSFPVGTEHGTLLLEFEADTIIRRQIFFCKPEAWLIPLPDSAKTSGGTRQVYESLLETLEDEFGASERTLTTLPGRHWESGIQLSFDSAAGLITLNLGPQRDTTLPWMLKPEGMPTFRHPGALSIDDPYVTRETRHDFQECLFGPDTLIGIPGVAYAGTNGDGSLRLHLWNSIIGVGSNILDSFITTYQRSLGPATYKAPNSATWILDSSVIRVVRIDSLTLYSIYYASLVPSKREQHSLFSDLHTRNIEFTQLASCSESEEAETRFDRSQFSRKGIFLYDRFIKPSVELCRKHGETRPLTLESIWQD